MTPIYAVPSRSRPDILRDWTLASLAASGVPRGDTHLVLDADQVDAYRAAIPDFDRYVLVETPLEVALAGIHAKRNWLVRQFPYGTRLVQCDDDLQAIVQARTRQRPLLPVKDLPAVVDWAFATCDRLGLGLWGAYPVDNPYFMRPNATTDLRFVAGCLHGWTVTGDDTEQVTLETKDDYERCVRFALRDGGVLRLNWIAYQTRYYDLPGGTEGMRTDEMIEDRAQRLAAMFPDQVIYRGLVGHRGKAEVRLRRGQAVSPPIPAPAHD